MTKAVKRLIIGAALLITGGVVVPAAGFGFLLFTILGDEPVVTIVGSGGEYVQIDDPGRFVLWYEYRTVHDGRTYATGPELPAGIEFHLWDDDGTEVDFEPTGGTQADISGVQRVSVGSFQLDRPGRYLLRVDGSLDRPRVFSLRKAVLFDAILIGLGISVLAVPLTLAGIGFGIAGIVGLVQKKDEQSV